MYRFVAALTGASALLFAQNTGRITGSVMDSSGAAIPDASLSLLMARGAAPIFTGKSGVDGSFHFAAVQAGTYDIAVEVKGFGKQILRDIKVDSGVERSLPPVRLEVASVAEVVEVSAIATGVQTSNAEITATITNQQISRLPSLNRSPLAFISLAAGVGGNSRTPTTINGLRPSFANVTLDGINIQDNFIRTNTLDFQPNMLQLDQVEEFTLATSNTSPMNGNGAAQVTFTTPSGTNKLQGSLYWFNRNNAVAANTWFNNRNRVARPFLNQNQIGGSIRGPIIKDKLFFYGNYEATRQHQQATANRTILRPEARQGIFRYRDTSGAVQSGNVLLMAGITADPRMRQILDQVPGPEKINRDDIGDTLNTGGYSFLVRSNRIRDNVTSRFDYHLSTNHTFYGTFIWNKDVLDRPGQSNDYSVVPKVANDNVIPFLSTTYRWSPTATFTNEARGGFNLAPGLFVTSENFGSSIIATPLVNNPVNTFRAQGRYTDTYNIQDNASWYKGRHTLTFGFQSEAIKIYSFNDADNLPTYGLGMATTNPLTFAASRFPGIRAADLGTANALLALHGGVGISYAQTFNATTRTSGFVGGAPNGRRFQQWNYALYFNDAWKVTPRLTLTLGVRWEYYTPVDEINALSLLPVITNGNPISTLLSNSTLDFAGSAVGRPWYRRDLNNYGPNIGVAWRPFGDKTVLRAGYSLNYPNDEFVRSIDNNQGTNSGLASSVSRTNLNYRVSALPAVPTPAYKVPRLFSDNYVLDSQSAFGLPDPNLRTPYVQQWHLSVQREMLKGVLDVRYVGNHATKQFRAFDYNQVVIKENGFLDDFKKAQNNGRLAQAAGRGFNPSFNAAIPGSQRLPAFDRLEDGGSLTNGTVANLILTGQAGELGRIYQISLYEGANFFRNLNALGTNMVTNYSNATYHALQVDFTRRFNNGLQWQANYVYSKVLSDSAGDGQTRFEPFLDIANAGIERARTPFDLTHSFKVNAAYELPVGKGRKMSISNPVLDRVVGGWAVSGFMTWTSGAPFSVNSGRGTLNRTGRSGGNTANSSLNKGQLDDLLRFRQTGNGPYFVGASAIGADGRAVASDGTAPFTGQVFSNPGAGEVGGLQRRMFSGPAFWNTDLRILKTFTIHETHRLELSGDLFNFTNTPSFFINDQDINSVNFGRITSTASDRRVVQFGLYYRF